MARPATNARPYCLVQGDDGRRCHRPNDHERVDDLGHAEVPSTKDWDAWETRRMNEEGASDQGWGIVEHAPPPRVALPNVALIAKRKSGKSTIAKQLVERYGFQRHSWADALRKVFAMAYDEDVLDPSKYEEVKRRLYTIADRDGYPIEVSGGWLLQRIGTEGLRDAVDLNFWIKAGERTLDRGPSYISPGNEAALSEVRWVNDDTRFPNELGALRKRGFAIVGLHVDDAIRSQRVGYDGRLDSHPSETSVSLDDADFVVDTGGTIDASISQLITGLVGITTG